MSLEYNTAKRLKDAGFPHISFNEIEIDGETIMTHEIYPSIEQLIEACGEGFIALQRELNGKRWTAYGETKLFSYYKTPEEAVAELWLTINGK